MNYEIEGTTVVSDGNKLSASLYETKLRQNPPGVLFLHGAGTIATACYDEWLKYLCERGYTSFIFECRGVGASEGEFEDGGLNNRLRDSQQALETFISLGKVDPNNIAVIGSSMGGHITIRLAEANPNIRAIILAYAAAYSEESESKRLDSTFTEAIRKENSWVDSPAFKVLKQYPGRVLVVYGENEEVVPKGIQEKYMELAKPIGEARIVKNIGHAMLQPKNEQEERATLELFKLSANFLDETFRTK